MRAQREHIAYSVCPFSIPAWSDRNRQLPALSLLDDALRLTLARVHDLCGTARRTLALDVAAAAGAPVLWIVPARGAAPLNPSGMSGILVPRDVLFVTPERPVDLLWAMEEALRSGAVPLVIAELADPPAMTLVRRLHLAAEAGAEAGFHRPLEPILTPGSGEASGIESRWRMEPMHTEGNDRWRLERLRSRMAPPRTCTIGRDTAQDDPDHQGPNQLVTVASDPA